MGPPGFWRELRQKGVGRQLEGPEVERLLEGRRVAVDAAIWIFEAQKQQQVAHVFGSHRATLKVIYERCSRWLRKGVLPVVVLEGTEGGRGARASGRGGSALGTLAQVQPQLKEILLALGVPCVQATGEAEAACAELAHSGVCDFAASRDFDVLLFGAPRVLVNLTLRSDSASTCELWELSEIERLTSLKREHLAMAAFMSGSDYDVRRNEREGAGVRGVGARKAISTLQALSQETGHAVDAVRQWLEGSIAPALMQDAAERLRPKRQTESLAMRSSTLARRRLGKIAAAVKREPDALCGQEAVERQYDRAGALASSLHVELSWTGIVDLNRAAGALKTVWPARAREKLQPLQMESVLRSIATGCPEASKRSAERRRAWAVCAGLPWVPLSARPRVGAKQALGAEVSWAALVGSTPSQKETTWARLGLAASCGLLFGRRATTRSCLKACLALLEDCPADVKRETSALRTWALERGVPMVPRGCEQPKGRSQSEAGAVRLLWADATTGRALPAQHSLPISVKQA